MGHKVDANVTSFPMSILVQVTTRLSLKKFALNVLFTNRIREVKKPFHNFSSTIFLLTPFIPALSNLFSPTSAFSSSWIGIPGILLPLKMSTHSTRFPPLSHFYFITRYGECSRSVARVKWPKTEERKKKKAPALDSTTKSFLKDTSYGITFFVFLQIKSM